MGWGVWVLSVALAADMPVQTRESDALQSNAAAWAGPGFRLGLQAGYESVTGLTRAPLRGAGPVLGIEPGLRISDVMSLALFLRYSGPNTNLGPALRWALSIGPSFHPTEGLVLSLGVGYAGLSINADSVESAGPELQGALAFGRVAYYWMVGPLFNTGPALQVDVQCAGTGPNKSLAWFGVWSIGWAFMWR